MTAILKVDTIQDTSGNNIINENSNTITIGASGDTITIPSGATLDGSNATLSGFATTNGITMADQWRVTTGFTGNSEPITSNWERNDTAPALSYFGSQMTESSGVFTFPSTGYWQVTAKGYITVNADTSAVIAIKTTNNNSTYSNVSYTGGGERSANDAVFNIETSIILEIDDISNDKVKFATSSLTAGSTVHGAASGLETRFTFVKLGDL